MRTQLAPAVYAVLLALAPPWAVAQEGSPDTAMAAIAERANASFQAAASQIALKDGASAKAGLSAVQIQVRDAAKPMLALPSFRALVVQVTYLRRLERGESLGSVRRVYETVPLYVVGGEEALAAQPITEVQEAVGASSVHCRGLVAPASLDADMLAQFMACLYTK